MKQTSNKPYVLLIYVALALATIVAFEQVRLNKFVNYDDHYYVTENQQVQAGITGESVFWAFTTTHAGNWHPLTWLSHMLDCQLFELNPMWHHLTSLLLHMANTLLLFWVLKRMTSAVWASAFVAAAFALHPLHVESVAWVAERKDVLSGFFWFLTMAAYVRYAERPSVGRYSLVILGLCLGLMAKPMLVTLPFVLLLLDYWPLGRLRWGSQSDTEASPESESVKVSYQKASVLSLIGEKIPLFILAAVSSVITFIVQQSGGAVRSWESFSLNIRISNALVSYISYIIKMIYPSRLAVLYPHPGDSLPIWQPIVCLVIVAAVSAGIIYIGRRRRYLVTGWLWYIGTLLPVIGLVQVGAQAMADRYTYLPSIGFFIMVAWGAAELGAKWRYRKIGAEIGAGIVLTMLLIFTRIQVRHWRSSLTLFGHTLEVTENNYIMHNYYGRALRQNGRVDEAIKEIRESLRLNPNYCDAHNNLGIALQARGKDEEAERQFRKALRLNPDYNKAHVNLGIMLAKQQKPDEAIKHFFKAIELNPSNAKAHHNLGQAFFSKGNIPGAIKHYRESLRLNPDGAASLNGLGWILATNKGGEFRDGAEAVRLAKRACELTNYKDPETLNTLAAAYAEVGRFTEAVRVAEDAIDLCLSTENEKRARDIIKLYKLYKTGQAYRANQ